MSERIEYLSNHGAGPLRAERVLIEGRFTVLLLHPEKGRRYGRLFRLPTWFLSHRSCGWQLALPHPHGTSGVLQQRRAVADQAGTQG